MHGCAELSSRRFGQNVQLREPFTRTWASYDTKSAALLLLLQSVLLSARTRSGGIDAHDARIHKEDMHATPWQRRSSLDSLG